MHKQPYINIVFGGVSLTDFGYKIPSPTVSLTIENSEAQKMTVWKLECTVFGDAKRQINSAAFEALMYQAAKDAANTGFKEQGTPISFMFGWQQNGEVLEYASYNGFSLKFNVNMRDQMLMYTIEGYAAMSIVSSLPSIQLPAISGRVQPSAVLEGVLNGLDANDYYEYDIDHCDDPVIMKHEGMTTSLNSYVRGVQSTSDDYSTFPGLLPLAKSVKSFKNAFGVTGNNPLATLANVLSPEKVDEKIQEFQNPNADIVENFSYWVDEPSMTQPGTVHFKSNAGLITSSNKDALIYGGPDTNVISLTGGYNSVAYSLDSIAIETAGFTVDGTGNTVATFGKPVSSWSNSVESVFKSSSVINDVNAIATQFSGTLSVDIAGSTKAYTIAQPVSLVVIRGGTLSPESGVYSIMNVKHRIDTRFITTLSLKRLTTGSANQAAASTGLLINNAPPSYVSTTPNVISPYKVNLGKLNTSFSQLLC